jgi:hypothetical protein
MRLVFFGIEAGCPDHCSIMEMQHKSYRCGLDVGLDYFCQEGHDVRAGVAQSRLLEYDLQYVSHFGSKFHQTTTVSLV